MRRKCPSCGKPVGPIDMFIRPGLIGHIGPVKCRHCGAALSKKLVEEPMLTALPAIGLALGLWFDDLILELVSQLLDKPIPVYTGLLILIAFIILLLIFIYYIFPLRVISTEE